MWKGRDFSLAYYFRFDADNCAKKHLLLLPSFLLKRLQISNRFCLFIIIFFFCPNAVSYVFNITVLESCGKKTLSFVRKWRLGDSSRCVAAVSFVSPSSFFPVNGGWNKITPSKVTNNGTQKCNEWDRDWEFFFSIFIEGPHFQRILETECTFQLIKHNNIFHLFLLLYF